ncbi:UbiH/UbiF family hydroxylase [Aurantimonas sp. VKM B-3413]|uniref:UbiH/UbiF family hydroxylase n=1 Tax=Aurantimonas sp. VKM B-3413 TaxID=2779401 RepID=UPI001E3FEE92|nr:UbiH/UbiF family hydroxylase [Aurantimonas sp. VKM B-3413]MCB8837113.1 UbiH/UbiF family hydroxylase [Aurantimonas sp. VKM B-3413]
MSIERREIAVVGGGLAGTATALGFAAKGFDTVLIAPETAADARSSALLGRSVAFLSEFGIMEALAGKAAPLSVMRLVDDTGGLLRAPTVEFHASEIGLSAFGYNVLNRDLGDALQERMASETNLERCNAKAVGFEPGEANAIVTLDDGSRYAVDLVVAADGRRSPIREAAGISVRQWHYPQTAIVFNFEHAVDHRSVSTEFHTRSGPVTQVPLPGRRSSLVWVEDPKLAELYADLRLEKLSETVADKLHWILGRVTVEEPIQRFPLGGAVVDRLTGDRLALVGEAGHAFPPIGAQGLNLGLRDGEAIVRFALESRDDPGRRVTLLRYEAARKADIRSRTLGVDLLNRSLLAGMLPMQLARSAGLAAMSRVPFLRQFAMREGLSPGAGLMGVPRSVRKWIGGDHA